MRPPRIKVGERIKAARIGEGFPTPPSTKRTGFTRNLPPPERSRGTRPLLIRPECVEMGDTNSRGAYLMCDGVLIFVMTETELRQREEIS